MKRKDLSDAKGKDELNTTSLFGFQTIWKEKVLIPMLRLFFGDMKEAAYGPVWFNAQIITKNAEPFV